MAELLDHELSATRLGNSYFVREIWNAKYLAAAEAGLKPFVEAYRNKAPELTALLEVAIPEGLAAFTLSEQPRNCTATSNPIESTIQPEPTRRTLEVRDFPDTASLFPLVTAVLIEIDGTWQASTEPDINWDTPGT